MPSISERRTPLRSVGNTHPLPVAGALRPPSRPSTALEDVLRLEYQATRQVVASLCSCPTWWTTSNCAYGCSSCNRRDARPHVLASVADREMQPRQPDAQTVPPGVH